jgi:phage terminase small subunit
MAGVKGRSGGPRPNSGGARPGAGRKPKPKQEPAVVGQIDPLAFLQGVMRGEIDATALQVRAAVAAAQYVHTKKHDGGKRDDAADAAKKAARGKFASAAPPLKIVGR